VLDVLEQPTVSKVQIPVPRWAAELLPYKFYDPIRKVEWLRQQLLHAAMLSGTTFPGTIFIPQVSTWRGTYNTNQANSQAWLSDTDLSILTEFGIRIKTNHRPTIMRTAVLLGLGCPEVEFGVCGPTRTDPLTQTELLTLLERAGQLNDQFKHTAYHPTQQRPL